MRKPIIFSFNTAHKTIMLTGSKTYGKKQIAIIHKGKEVTVLNLMGFGFWIFKKGLI